MEGERERERERRHTAVAAALLDHRAAVNAQSADGHTPLLQLGRENAVFLILLQGWIWLCPQTGVFFWVSL